MHGDIAPLKAICDLADKYNAYVVVDDSHATGFMGKNGRGTHEHNGVGDRVDFITSTFGVMVIEALAKWLSNTTPMIITRIAPSTNHRVLPLGFSTRGASMEIKTFPFLSSRRSRERKEGLGSRGIFSTTSLKIFLSICLIIRQVL